MDRTGRSSGRKLAVMAGALRALRRLPPDTWLVLQGTVAATAAWVIATRVVGNHEPFFAPIAAFVALNASRGERGRNALRLLLGVVIGIVAGELTILTLGGGYGSLALAVFAATAAARALGGAPIVIAQAAAGAILTVAVSNGEAGTQRLVDALIGVGVALLFTQVLFSPEPLALLRRAEATALADMAKALHLTAGALEQDDDDVAEQAMSQLRTLRDGLSELGRTRAASGRVARRSAVWRSQIAPVVRETEDAGRLDLLGGSCLTLTRIAMVTDEEYRRRLAPRVLELADALADLAGDPGDRATRQQAADRALDVARRLVTGHMPSEPEAIAATVAVRTVASDLMVFAGVDADVADAAVREGTGEFRVPAPPSSPRTPFGLRRPAR
jgi:fusaric acid resistance family protein